MSHCVTGWQQTLEVHTIHQVLMEFLELILGTHCAESSKSRQTFLHRNRQLVGLAPWLRTFGRHSTLRSYMGDVKGMNALSLDPQIVLFRVKLIIATTDSLNFRHNITPDCVKAMMFMAR